MQQIFHSFLKDKRGSLLILAAFAIPVVILGSAAAIEYSRYYKTVNQLTYIADQAAIAAAAVDRDTPAEYAQLAEDLVYMNMTEELKSYVELESVKDRVNVTMPSPTENLQIRIRLVGEVKLLFGQTLSMPAIGFRKVAQATREVMNAEVVFALPSSGTMCSHKSYTGATNALGDLVIGLSPDPSCTDFEAMKTAVETFSDKVFANATVNEFSLGLVPYNIKVKMPNLSSIPPLLTSEDVAGFFGDFAGFEPLSEVVPLTNNESAINSAISGLTLSDRATGWNRTNVGLLTAGMMLDPAFHSYFGGEVPEDLNTGVNGKRTRKLLVLMTDGSNIGCCFTNIESDFTKQYVYEHKPSTDQTLEYCEEIKRNGVEVYTVLFSVNPAQAGGRHIDNVFAQCASEGVTDDPATLPSAMDCETRENCYVVTDINYLRNVFVNIAQTFYKPSLTF